MQGGYARTVAPPLPTCSCGEIRVKKCIRPPSAHLDHAAVQGRQYPWALGVEAQPLHPVRLGLKLGQHFVSWDPSPRANSGTSWDPQWGPSIHTSIPATATNPPCSPRRKKPRSTGDPPACQAEEGATLLHLKVTLSPPSLRNCISCLICHRESPWPQRGAHINAARRHCPACSGVRRSAERGPPADVPRAYEVNRMDAATSSFPWADLRAARLCSLENPSSTSFNTFPSHPACPPVCTGWVWAAAAGGADAWVPAAGLGVACGALAAVV